MTDQKKGPELPELPTSLPTSLPTLPTTVPTPTEVAAVAAPDVPTVDLGAANAAVAQMKNAAEVGSAVTDVLAMGAQLPEALSLLNAVAAALGG